MKAISEFPGWFSKQKLSGKLFIGCTGLIFFICLCGIIPAIITPSKQAPKITSALLTTTPTFQQADSVVFTTWTPTLTHTPAPTDTPSPTFTPTPLPTPIYLTSYGDSVFDFQKWKGPAILKIKYTGGRNFAVRNYPVGSNDYYDLLVNTIGDYEGTVPLDFKDGEQTARFEVIATGTWIFQIEPLANARTERIPGTITGMGDDVILIGGGKPDLLKADASQASHNFAVRAIANASFDLVFNEIAPYTGTKILDPATIALIVNATGPWALEVTTR